MSDNHAVIMIINTNQNSNRRPTDQYLFSIHVPPPGDDTRHRRPCTNEFGRLTLHRVWHFYMTRSFLVTDKANIAIANTESHMWPLD